MSSSKSEDLRANKRKHEGAKDTKKSRGYRSADADHPAGDGRNQNNTLKPIALFALLRFASVC